MLILGFIVLSCVRVEVVILMVLILFVWIMVVMWVVGRDYRLVIGLVFLIVGGDCY